jgi:hypothetical protein
MKNLLLLISILMIFLNQKSFGRTYCENETINLSALVHSDPPLLVVSDFTCNGIAVNSGNLIPDNYYSFSGNTTQITVSYVVYVYEYDQSGHVKILQSKTTEYLGLSIQPIATTLNLSKSSFCSNENPVTLTGGKTTGGSYKLDNTTVLSGDVFDPASVASGPHPIPYPTLQGLSFRVKR